MIERAPRLSIGLAVRNGIGTAERCIESVLSQTFSDLELVVCDNASSDDTLEMLRRYAKADGRVRVSQNEINIGVHENIKRVLMLARGELFRWISADDWLEPGCLAACVKALDDHPDAIGVTTGFSVHAPNRAPRHEDYAGEFPSSHDPAERFARMVWFFHAGDAVYDPVYGMYRREALLRCNPLRPSERTDWLLSVALALAGPIIHIPERLAHRTNDPKPGADRAAFRRRLDPLRGEQLKTSATRLCRQMEALAVSADLTDAELARCRQALRRFWVGETIRTTRSRLSDARYGVLRRLGRHA